MNNQLTIELIHSQFEPEDYIEHHGIMGMKWGVRRYQNEDGSYTEAGRKRYGIGSERKSAKQVKRFLNENDQDIAINKSLIKRSNKQIQAAQRKYEKAVSKGNTKKAQKYKDRIDHWTDIQNTATKDLNKARSEQDDVLNEAKKHYNVKLTDISRVAETGWERAQSLANVYTFGGILGGLMNVGEHRDAYVHGTKYNVKNVKSGKDPEFIDKRKIDRTKEQDVSSEKRSQSNEKSRSLESKQNAARNIANSLNGEKGRSWKTDNDTDLDEVVISRSGKLKSGKPIMVKASIGDYDYGSEKGYAKSIRSAYNNRDKIYEKAIDALVDSAYNTSWAKDAGLTKSEIRKGFSDDVGIRSFPIANSKKGTDISSGELSIWCPEVMGGHVGYVDFSIDNKGNVKTNYTSFEG